MEIESKNVSSSPNKVKSGVGIPAYHDNDVLCGRGQSANIHPGNVAFRALVQGRLEEFNSQPNTGEGNILKSKITQSFVDHIRFLDPPGRFLKKNAITGLYDDIGDDAAKEKAREVLKHLRRQERLKRIKIEAKNKAENETSETDSSLQEKRNYINNLSQLESGDSVIRNDPSSIFTLYNKCGNETQGVHPSNLLASRNGAVTLQSTNVNCITKESQERLLRNILQEKIEAVNIENKNFRSLNFKSHQTTMMDNVNKLIGNDCNLISNTSFQQPNSYPAIMNKFGSHLPYGVEQKQVKHSFQNTVQSRTPSPEEIELTRLQQIRKNLESDRNHMHCNSHPSLFNHLQQQMFEIELREKFLSQLGQTSTNNPSNLNGLQAPLINQINMGIPNTGPNMRFKMENVSRSMQNNNSNGVNFKNISDLLSSHQLLSSRINNPNNGGNNCSSQSSLLNLSTVHERPCPDHGAIPDQIPHRHNISFNQNKVSHGKLNMLALERAREVASLIAETSYSKACTMPKMSLSHKRKPSSNSAYRSSKPIKKPKKERPMSDNDAILRKSLQKKSKVISIDRNELEILRKLKKEQDEKETSNDDQLNAIKNPHENDVLCGRGQCTNDHPGNIYFRAIVA
eukprot:CAMPEP_0113320772 /NCGR_PEP_ID=MMETSP0010_2-20120614/14480_1 /TAXON_ID=216773 ORGANISM="Corethron hystrix, Strain 308" /NCGR_SAMPLE_ID=MMETSP0010_2 /ASSEMBLY_ACC=CAM_ASM_000155 /LENGTH=625 /DNA_ID=CAMNT_0000178687 /DNA_START=121 /DNA_END=1994 /DNA_ORIENTATION=+ /assembly_acc=CAM_ASM_000155